MHYNMPSLVEIESEMIRRGLKPVMKAIPTEGDADLPAVINAADRLEGPLRREMLKTFKTIREEMPVDDITRAIPSGQYAHILNAYIERAFKERLFPVIKNRMRLAFIKGAKAGIPDLRLIGVEVRQATATIRFDLVNAAAVQWAEANAGRLITEVTAQQIVAAAMTVSTALEIGRTVDQVAGDLRAFIGLRSDQVTTLANFRQDLIDSGLPDAIIERRVARRAQGLLSKRTRMIARTEIVNSANAGQRALWNEAAQQGVIDKTTTLKVWITTIDDLAEVHCLALDDVAIPLDAQFESEIGNVDGPTLHPNCRCGLKLQFTDR